MTPKERNNFKAVHMSYRIYYSQMKYFVKYIFLQIHIWHNELDKNTFYHETMTPEAIYCDKEFHYGHHISHMYEM